MKKTTPPPLPPRAWTRRETVQVLATSAAALGTVGAGLWLSERYEHPAPRSLLRIADHRVQRPADAVQLAIARGPRPEQNVRKALLALGGMEAFVRPGDKVVVKPNVGWNRLPEQAANTDPDVVAEVVRQVVAARAAKVWVADVSVNSPDRCFERSGIQKATGEAGGTLVLPSTNAFREVAVGGVVLQAADVLWPFVEADKIINVPVVKQHGLSRATLAMKNWYGVLGGHRARLHQDIGRSIVDLAKMMKPTLTVLDATRILMANGPTGGSLSDVKRLDTVAVGTDEVALDTFGAELLGLAADEVSFLELAERAGLGTRRYKELRLVELT